jgi:uncharacterized protein YcbK (DUF882 family)
MTAPVRALAVALAATAAGSTLAMSPPARPLAPITWSVRAPAPDPESDAAVRVAQQAFGRSGQLRVLITDPHRTVPLPMEWAAERPAELAYRWVPLSARPGLLGGEARLGVGPVAPAAPGIYRLALTAPGFRREVHELSVITRVPFSQKRGGYLNGYHIGAYETETDGIVDAYAPPPGFIEVTRENQDLQVSTHFRLRNFLTKNQFGTWPKYLALDLRLIDKLELVIQELNAMGIRAENVAVMSGFRTPAYNLLGVGEGGRALLSRHTYGDASDFWIDNDFDGYMDDLNGDGLRDMRDAAVIRHAADRVEAKHPDLVGGVGVYPDNGAHGPFVHIDARGTFSRW